MNYIENTLEMLALESRYGHGIIQHIASLSTDETKVGAAIYDNEGKLLLIGNNGFCTGLEVTDERNTNDNKHNYTVHAEAGIIAEAARVGIPLKDTVIWIHGKCICNECAKLVISSGINRIFCPFPDPEGSSRWAESNRLAVKNILENGNCVLHLMY